MAPPRTRAHGLGRSLTLVVACCATACFNPSGTDTTASGTSTGGPGSTTGSPTTGITSTSDTTLPGTSTSGTTAVDPTTAGTSTDASTTSSATASPASSTDPSSTGETTADQTTGLMAVCGDGFYVPGVEECDDGNLDPLDSCDAECKRTSFAIFTSAPVPSGAFGGLAEADAICQTEATNVGRQGLYRAFLSDDNVAAVDHVQHKDGFAYYTVDGVLLANTWSDLFTKGPMAPINHDVTGAKLTDGMSCINDLVWTGTDNSGQQVKKSNCDNWLIGLDKTGVVGSYMTSGMNPAWITCGMFANCTSMARLYCIEQPLP